MSKNVLIFADGTGQAGGFRPDQMLSNVYKLYRATRSGPDSPIDPAQQVAFYDPGLGTTTGGGLIQLRAWDIIKALAGSVAGIGISTNVTDCYEAILKHYAPGDRVYLFGFSRGAYTARSVAGVLNLCGVPKHDAQGQPLPRSGSALRQIADEAVRKVYDHGAGKPRAYYEDEREELARRFRRTYGSGDDHAAEDYPYFIGLFDAVAALGLPALPRLALGVLLLSALVGVSWLAGSGLHTLWGWDATLMRALVFGALLAGSIVAYLRSTLKWIRGFSRRRHWLGMHLARWHGEHYDRFLDPRVNVVRHALSIDETRRDFVRVKWGRPTDQPSPQAGELERFQQYWFAGNHSDVGGSYPEDESRLSDIALNWLVTEATDALHPILVDHSKLQLYPAVDGPQHCQVEALRDSYPGWWPQAWRKSWRAKPRTIPPNATLHPSVLRRFELSSVVHCGSVGPYRPAALRQHQDLRAFYPPSAIEGDKP
jgi:hypothetical protein